MFVKASFVIDNLVSCVLDTYNVSLSEDKLMLFRTAHGKLYANMGAKFLEIRLAGEGE